MSLTSCLKKAGAALHPKDKGAILAAARKYRASGLDADAAAKKAVDDQIATVSALLNQANVQARPVVPMTWDLRDTGSLAIKGDPDQIIAKLKAGGITKTMVMQGGIMVSKTQAQKALAILEEKPAAAKPLMVGITPSNAEPVTVKNGVIHIGADEAIDFDSGEPVKAKADASAAELKQALKDAGALSKRQKFFGGAEGKVVNEGSKVVNGQEGEGLTAPTQAEVLEQQERKANADALDEKAQVDREAEHQGLTAQNAPEQRKDTTGDLLGGPTAEEALAARGQAEKRKAKPAAVAGQGDLLGSADKPAANTEDAGAELSYNKRNRVRTGMKWSDYEKLDPALRVREAKKDKVYPRPDYQAMVDSGLEPVVVHVVKQAYDAIANEPQVRGAPSDADIQKYIAGVNRYMAGVLAWAEDSARTTAWLQRIGRSAGATLGAMRGGVTRLSDLAGPTQEAPTLLQTVYPDSKEGMRNNGWREHAEEMRMIGGNKVLQALQPFTDDAIKALKEIEKGWPGKTEAWQRRGYRIIAPKLGGEIYNGERYDSKQAYTYAHVKFDDKGVTRTLESKIFEGGDKAANEAAAKQWMAERIAQLNGKSLLVNKSNTLQGAFDTAEQAREKARELTKRDTGGGVVDEKGISVESAARTGPEHRQEGENVSSERLMQAFGFKGVNFGNWMKGKSNEAERQLHLNHAYDSFMDLAQALGVPPQAMSLNGMLGIALGAQGNGRYAAHFVPGVNEINLTRTAGAGALAHEWGHALDHYFARQAGLDRQAEPFLTEHTERPTTSKRMELVDGKYVNVERENFQGIRPEIVDRFKAVVQAMNKREMTPEEVASRDSAIRERAQQDLKRWIDATRKNMASKMDAAQLEKLLAPIERGDLGEYVSKFPAAIDALGRAYKAAWGRQYRSDQLNGLMHAARFAKRTREKVAEESHQPQLTGTTYAGNAFKLDKDKGGKAYWSTNLEKFARAFDAFVQDKLAAQSQANTYLHGRNQNPETSPQGAERTAINKAIQGLVDAIDTKETDKGVAMFSRGESAEPFYSALSREVATIPAKAQSAQGWTEQIKGLVAKGKIKADEVEWTGLNDWLALQPGRVTKEQITDYLKANGVQVQTVQKGGNAEKIDVIGQLDDLVVRADALGYTFDRNTFEGDGGDYFSRQVIFTRRSDGAAFEFRPGENGWQEIDSEGFAGGEAELPTGPITAVATDIAQLAQDETEGNEPDGTRYGNYTLPGGQRYREVLLTLPSNARSLLPHERGSIGNVVAEAAKDFRSNHFDEPNILAHVRLNDRTDADGKRVLFVEEIQSDWAQKGKRQGFNDPTLGPRLAKLEQEKAALEAQFEGSDKDAPQAVIDRHAALGDEIDKLRRQAGRQSVPVGPFVGKTDAWVSLAIKRIVKMAVDEGYDKVAFVNGEQSADRYDLSKQVKRLDVLHNRDGTFNLTARTTNDVTHALGHAIARDKLADHIGKELAEKAAAQTPGQQQSYSGIDLKVGGEGMKAFYDKIVPSVAKDVLRKLGGGPLGKVGIPQKVTDYQRTARWVGPARSIQDVRMMSELAERGGRSVHENPLTGAHEMFAINRVAVAQDLRHMLRDMEAGKSFAEALVHPDVSGTAAELFGGRVERFDAGHDVLQQPGFDITPAMREKAEGGMPLFARGARDSVTLLADQQRLGAEVLQLEDAIGAATKELNALIQYGKRRVNRAESRDRIYTQERAIARLEKQLADKRKELAAVEREQKAIKPLDDVRNQRALFKRGSLASPNAKGTLSTQGVRTLLAPALAKLQIPYSIHATTQDAAQAVGLDIPATAKGFHWRGELHLIANNLRSTLQAQEVFWHEVQHAGLSQALGAGSKAYEDALREIAANNENIREAAKAWLVRHGETDYGYRISMGKTHEEATALTRLQAIDEALAELSGRKGEKINGIAKFVAKIQELLHSIGLHELAKWLEGKTDAQALSVILASRKAVMGEGTTREQGEMAPAFSQSAMKSADANIARGRAAMNKALLEKADQHRAMHRTGLGWVDFVWGDDKKGLQHILGEREKKDGMDRAAVTRFLTQDVVDTIANGSEARRQEVRGALNLWIEKDGKRAVLVRQRGGNGWLLTGFEVPGGRGEGFDSTAPTQPKPTVTRQGQGAGTGEIVPPDDNISFAREGATDLFAPDTWSAPEPSKLDRVTYELQDGRIDLKRVQEAIKKTGADIEEKFDARQAETLYPGRVARRAEQFLHLEVKPLLVAMAKVGASMNELGDYLIARHAPERNEQIAKVNPDLPDGGAGRNSAGTLMTNDAAAHYLAALPAERRAQLAALAEKVDAITRGTRVLLVAEGLEKPETVAAWEGAYRNYVPLFKDEAGENAYPHPQGMGFTVKGPASKRATGSTKEVTNVLAHVLMQREAAITRAEKNRVGLALYGLALSNPNPAFWTTIKPGMSNEQIGRELTSMGVDPDVAVAGMHGVPTIRTVDPLTQKVVSRPNPMYKSLPGAITLKVNGDDRVLMINVHNERGARLAENLKNLDGLTRLDLANSVVGKATRWIASVNTQYNPAFGLVNLTRDIQEGMINTGSTAIRGKALTVLANVPMALQGITRELATGGGGEWGRLFKQFQEDGGRTGYREMFAQAEDRAKAIEKELTAAHSAGKLTLGKVGHAVLDLLDGFNTTLENATRLAAYKVALDQGLSRPKAAVLARELTVDFNRKGRMGRELGPLYAFFNASVQGAERAIRTLTGPTGARVVAGGLMLGVIQALMLAAAGYDDDEIPEFAKTRAFIIPLKPKDGQKRYISIPMPLGFLWVPNAGRVMTELTLNGGKDLGKRVFNAVGEVAGSFSPFGGGNPFTADGALRLAAPTVVDPLIEVGFNKNFAGNAIERPAFKGETDNRPGFARAKEATLRSTTGQVYLGISKAINALTGGNAYEAGVASPTPERVHYLAQVIGGGVLRELEKSVDGAVKAAHGEKVKMSAVPLLGRFAGEVDDDQVQTARYFNAGKQLETLQTSISAARKAGDGEAMARMIEQHPELALARAHEQVQRQISALNHVAVQTIGDPDTLKALDEARTARMKALNTALKELEQASGKVTLGQKLRGAMKPAELATQ